MLKKLTSWVIFSLIAQQTLGRFSIPQKHQKTDYTSLLDAGEMESFNMTEGSTNSSGSIAEILGNNIADIAIINADNRHGDWKYSLDNGVTWTPVGSVSDTHAISLNDKAKIRFVPSDHFNGNSGITLRTLDKAHRTNGKTVVNVSVNNGKTTFSSTTSTSSIYVTPSDNVIKKHFTKHSVWHSHHHEGEQESHSEMETLQLSLRG